MIITKFFICQNLKFSRRNLFVLRKKCELILSWSSYMSFFFFKISLSQSQKSWESLLNYLQYLQARRIMDIYPLSRKRKLFIVNSGSLSFLNGTEIKFSITDIQNFNFTHEMYKFIICNLHYVYLLIHFTVMIGTFNQHGK